MTKYRATIGIETHVQLKTKSKLFSAVGNDARGAEPNSLISHIDFGLPGALPVLNQQALKLVTKAALALGTKPEKFSKFDRKHYFYPDLPKGYQISQYDQPVIASGQVTIVVAGKEKTIGITRAHLEEDAGKSSHPVGADYSLVDLNRAGTPLLEIVSQPDMTSAAEAKAYSRELYLLMKYADVSDADLYQGNMRFDVNVSVSDSDKLGIRTETKNLNSFRAVEKAVDYEIKRQTEALKQGQEVVQETRGWDESKQRTFVQRSKEEAEDYRYMPDPDLPPIVLDEAFDKQVAQEMPVMPSVWRARLRALGLEESMVETLLEAEVEQEGVSYLSLIEQSMSSPDVAKYLANWFVNLEIPLRRSETDLPTISQDRRNGYYLAVNQLISDNLISSTNARQLLEMLLMSSEEVADIAKFAKDKGLLQVSDEEAISGIVAQVVADNPKAVADIKKGETKAIGFLVGQVMKVSNGQANPKLAEELIQKQIEQL